MNLLSPDLPELVRCVDVQGEGDAVKRLKRLGICTGRVLHRVHLGDPLIVEVLETRIGLSRKLASHVIVEEITKQNPETSAPSTTVPETEVAR